jgi:hypothetical protein
VLQRGRNVTRASLFLKLAHMKPGLIVREVCIHCLHCQRQTLHSVKGVRTVVSNVTPVRQFLCPSRCICLEGNRVCKVSVVTGNPLFIIPQANWCIYFTQQKFQTWYFFKRCLGLFLQMTEAHGCLAVSLHWLNKCCCF